MNNSIQIGIILFCCFLLKAVETNAQNFEECELVIPPLIWGGIHVEHSIFGAVDLMDVASPTSQLCIGSGYFVPMPRIHLGFHDGLCGWNPFVYELKFSQAINSISFAITNGGHGIDSIDFGAENFVIGAECSAVSIESLFSCNSMILGDTIYVGVIIDNFGVGNGWFRVNFSQPVTSFTISGKGGGCGAGFKICANSMYQSPLWAGVKGPELLCGGGSLSFERYGWLAGPYTYNYNINGGPEQSFVTDEILAEIPLETLFGSQKFLFRPRIAPLETFLFVV